MLHSKSPISRRKAKRKVQYCQTVQWAKRVWSCIKIWKCHLFRWIHTLNLFLLQTYSHLASETLTNLSTLHWWMGKNPLESYWGDYLVTFKGVSQLKLVNETITSNAYQDNTKSDIKLQYECTLPQTFYKITHLAIALYNIHVWFILELYIAFDIILICLTGDCFINKLKLRDPLEVTR